MKYNREFESELMKSLELSTEQEDWINYSTCKASYINARKEKDINGFLYEFKERCDSVLYIIIYA